MGDHNYGLHILPKEFVCKRETIGLIGASSSTNMDKDNDTSIVHENLKYKKINNKNNCSHSFKSIVLFGF